MKLLLIITLICSIAFTTKGQQQNGNLIFDSSDLRIIQEADALLPDSLKWNKQDDRECTDDIANKKYSLFCALYKASIDVTGTYIHRRAAMQLIRFTVEKYDNGSVKDHRLMDWNNSSKTTFAQLKMMLKEAMGVVEEQLGNVKGR